MAISKPLRRAAAIFMAGLLPTVSLLAQERAAPGGDPAPEAHVVPLIELHQAAVAASSQRQDNVSRLERFFTGETAEKALRTVRLNGNQVRDAIASLDNEELARLAARADKANSDFAAGSLTNQELTYIVIALGTAVLILVIVAAR